MEWTMMIDWFWAVLGLLGAIIHVVVLTVSFLASAVILIFFVMFAVGAFTAGIARLAAPKKPAAAKWPRRIPTAEGDVIVYPTGMVHLIDDRGTVWRAKLHWTLVGDGGF
ncbi:MAG: hypothetical protein ABL901_12690 [Hyphomicrobiaceae bacterium]